MRQLVFLYLIKNKSYCGKKYNNIGSFYYSEEIQGKYRHSLISIPHTGIVWWSYMDGGCQSDSWL